MDVISYCKDNYEYEQLQNCIRVNGVVDIYKRKKGGKISIFILPEQIWYYPENEEEFSDIVINHLELYQKRTTFKKTEKGRMTYQEFKHSKHFVPLNTYRKNTKNMKDDSLMPFGKYKGDQMVNVPADYLIWLFENNKCGGEVLAYIRANETNLRQEIANNKKGIR